MDLKKTTSTNPTNTTETTEALRSVLKSQYHAALAMLKEAIERCPANRWSDKQYQNSPWQIAYHTLYFSHLYLQPNEFTFRPWKGHQADVQHPDALSKPNDPDSTLPLTPSPYTKEQVLEYWNFCDQLVDDALEVHDLKSRESGFSWYKVSKLEHQLINIRHIQHGAAQLADRLRLTANIGINWVGAQRSSRDKNSS